MWYFLSSALFFSRFYVKFSVLTFLSFCSLLVCDFSGCVAWDGRGSESVYRVPIWLEVVCWRSWPHVVYFSYFWLLSIFSYLHMLSKSLEFPNFSFFFAARWDLTLMLFKYLVCPFLLGSISLFLQVNMTLLISHTGFAKKKKKNCCQQCRCLP